MIHPAAFSELLRNGQVACHLCPAECRLTVGKHGNCASRSNQNNVLVTDNYGEAVSVAVDPIEKKPLYHFYPGSRILSTGPNCCNLGCTFCQNWGISQQKADTTYVSPDQLVQLAKRERSIGIAFTYTEPMIWFEYIMDVAPLARAAGLKIVLVSNGYLNPEPLDALISITDAFNIDLKGIRDRFYIHLCKGKLGPVLDNIRRIAASGCHLEVTNLIIPGENDSDQDISDLVDFVASVSGKIPLHFSAYHPDYKLSRPPTPPATLFRARELALKKLDYVYVGNLGADEFNDTGCLGCGEVLVKRAGFRASMPGLRDGNCSHCGRKADIIV